MRTKKKQSNKIKKLNVAEDPINAIRKAMKHYVAGNDHLTAILVILFINKKQQIEVRGESASGKNFLVESIFKMLGWQNEKEYLRITRASETMIDHLPDKVKDQIEILYFYEANSKVDSMVRHLYEGDHGREAYITQQGKNNNFSVSQKRTVQKGVIMTSTRRYLHNEDNNRRWLFTIDQSKKQIEKVKKFMADREAFGITKTPSIVNEIRNHISSFPKFEEILNPFANCMNVPPQHRMNRDLPKIWTLAKEIAKWNYKNGRVMNYKNRKYLVVGLRDLEEAINLAKGSIRQMVSGLDQRVLDFYDDICKYVKTNCKLTGEFTIPELVKGLKNSDTTVRRNMKALQDQDLIICSDSTNKPHKYQITNNTIEVINLQLPKDPKIYLIKMLMKKFNENNDILQQSTKSIITNLV